MRVVLSLILCCFSLLSFSQRNSGAWVDSVYNSFTEDERIAQLMIVRLSTIDLKTNIVTYFDKEVEDFVKKYNVGGVIVFQGAPVKQAETINRLQQIAKTPIMISIDAEWGLGQRMFDSILLLPKQMMLGAMTDSSIVYKYGKIVADQCKRLGIHVNYAPVVDVNNNPANPVINDRSFGENKYKVAIFGIEYMKGLQDNHIMACAKHFPGHGDVSVDSHLDLPVINKSLAQLDSLELYPFKRLFAAGVASVMNAHLYIPAIDNTKNRATSLSEKNIKGLLQDQLGFKGLIFTDALEMQGVQKFFPKGEAAVQALKAGSDMLCLPADIPLSIAAIKDAIKTNQISWTEIEMHCKKVLAAKYEYVLDYTKPIDLNNLTNDLNSEVPEMTRLVAENAITLLSGNEKDFLSINKKEKIAYIGFGSDSASSIAVRLKNNYNADTYFFTIAKNNPASVKQILESLKNYNKVIVGIHNINRPPLNNFGISQQTVEIINQIESKNKTIILLFGNAYAAKNWCDASNLIVCYEDGSIIQHTALDMLEGRIPFKGTLPVTVCKKFVSGFGINTEHLKKKKHH